MGILKLIFASIFCFMIYATTMASLSLNLFQHLPTLVQDPWAVMTLYDAYFAFLFFYIWLFTQETWVPRILWFVLIVCFGTIAMSLYMLIRIFQLKENEGIAELLLRKRS